MIHHNEAEKIEYISNQKNYQNSDVQPVFIYAEELFPVNLHKILSEMNSGIY